ncbi:MAG TPA: rod shape-determining protein RodA, partial [Aquifex aeolicus]|nr:rod shape-determining protein RodA [Aquifex aeolicus]
MRFPEALKGLDWSLVGLLLVIQVFGVLGVYSASLGEGSPIFFKKHILYLLVGWAAIFIIAREKFRNFLDLSLYLYLFVLFLLLMVLVVGKEVYGARR